MKYHQLFGCIGLLYSISISANTACLADLDEMQAQIDQYGSITNAMGKRMNTLPEHVLLVENECHGYCTWYNFGPGIYYRERCKWMEGSWGTSLEIGCNA